MAAALAATGALFGACWSGAIWYWRAHNLMPGTGDLALYLVALPLALLLALWAARGWQARRAAIPAATPVATAAAPAPAPPAPQLAIVVSALRTPHGASSEALAGAIAAGSARPALDAALLDEQGYPVLAARVPAAGDHEAARAGLAQALAAGVRYDGEQWRALALGGAVAAELGARLAAPATPLRLHLHVVWSAGWTPAQRDAAAAWFATLLAAGGWPADHISIAPSGDDEDAASVVVGLLAAAPSLPAVVLACDSRIGTNAVEAMADAGQLLTARNTQGQAPGEGAAAVLLADPAHARVLAPHDAVPVLRALATDTGAVDALCARALDVARCAPGDVALGTADADHRTAPVMALMSALSSSLPHLDPAADLLRTGEACGSCASVGWLAALALAADAARERAAPAICIGTRAPIASVAVVAPQIEAPISLS